MAEAESIANTRRKALKLNLSRKIYGSLSEIGAGQEVARQFFQAGGASGTVAKTLSAYDMQMSDAIYGPDASGRYVTRARLESMLEREYNVLIDRVSNSRSPDTTYFAFADTVAAKAYKSNRDCHGWMGIRFQHVDNAAPSQVILHVRMLDSSNRDQQEALGILGVNLIYSAFTHVSSPDALIDSLVDDLAWGRIEINFVEFSGPAFPEIDNRKMNLRLVTSSLGPVVMFAKSGEAVVPSEFIYKKHVLILRGIFRPFDDIHAYMIDVGTEAFAKDLNVERDEVVCFSEMNVARYLSEGLDEVSDLEERIARITNKGFHTMVSSHFRYFRFSEYFSKFDERKIGYIVSADNVRALMDEKYYEGMEGGILEAMGKLFASDSKLLVFPNLTPDGQLMTAENVEVPSSQKYLYRHLLHNRRLIPLKPDITKLVPFVAS
jgi:hypothetical protein